MSGINKNIYFQTETYNQLVAVIGKGKLSKFVNEAVEEKLIEIERNRKEIFNKKLVSGYKERAKNQELDDMIEEYGKLSWEDISTDLHLKEKKKNEQKNK